MGFSPAPRQRRGGGHGGLASALRRARRPPRQRGGLRPLGRGHGRVEHLAETFGTTTSELERLARWLAGHGVTHAAMEATGVYWKPVWAVLAEAFELVLANAMHVRNVPGRKTDVNDATWLADLLAHGLIRASFVPADGDPGAARPHPHPQAAHPREGLRTSQRIDKLLQASQPQARLGALRHHGRQRAGHPRRAGRRGERSRAPRRPGPDPDPRLPRPGGRGPARPPIRPSASAAPDPPRPGGCDRRRRRRDRRRAGRAPRSRSARPPRG